MCIRDRPNFKGNRFTNAHETIIWASKNKKSKYTFNSIAEDIFEVLDQVKVQKSHFVGISLGTILVRKLAEIDPKRVSKMNMGAAN